MPSSQAQAASPNKSMAALNTRIRKLPEKYVPSMKGNKYAVVLTQIVASLKESKDAISTAQMSVKLMNKGVHQSADIVGMVMAQLSLKAAIKKWGGKAKYAITAEMKPLQGGTVYGIYSSDAFMQANRFASQKNFTNIGLDRLGQQRLSQE